MAWCFSTRASVATVLTTPHAFPGVKGSIDSVSADGSDYKIGHVYEYAWFEISFLMLFEMAGQISQDLTHYVQRMKSSSWDLL